MPMCVCAYIVVCVCTYVCVHARTSPQLLLFVACVIFSFASWFVREYVPSVTFMTTHVYTSAIVSFRTLSFVDHIYSFVYFVVTYYLQVSMAENAPKRKRVFKKYSYRGVDLDALLDMGYAHTTHQSHCARLCVSACVFVC